MPNIAEDGSSIIRDLLADIPKKACRISVIYFASHGDRTISKQEVFDKKGKLLPEIDEEVLFEVIEEALSEDFPQWDSDEGSSGYLFIDLKEGTFECQHTEYSTTSEEHEVNGEF